MTARADIIKNRNLRENEEVRQVGISGLALLLLWLKILAVADPLKIFITFNNLGGI